MDKEQIEKLAKSPVVMIAIGLAAMQCAMKKDRRIPKWIERLAGPWRGKGSFGKNFGPQSRRK
jgi:hypothetical protein